MKARRLYFFITAIILVAIAFYTCNIDKPEAKADTVSPYLNHHDSVQYVGMQTCRSCHADIYDTYIQTGMGKSFDNATPQKSDAFFNHHAIVYDTINNFYYKPYFKNDSLFIHEFRLNKKDTIHSRTEFVSYIIGSGNHTNSHLVNFNGFVYQAPITFYTQKQQWDLAPGFEKGFNSRFERIIAHECMTCHNGLPDFVAGSENLYKSVPNGIDCERCHGAGGLHVKEKLAGNIVDTSKQPDYTIVNPRRLSKSLQMSLCQRCHLQGVSVLNDGKTFDAFKPGMNLGDIFHVFLPEFESKQQNFLMASQAERLRLSNCYQQSEMTCITCHNPHVSVKNTSKKSFNKKCQECHTENSKFKTQNTKNETQNLICTVSEKDKQLNGNDCSGCHMPKSGAVDIPHVSIHDHYIRKENLDAGKQLPLDEIEKIQQFVQLKCYTTDTPNALLKAKAFLAFYEKFSTKKVYLDSALLYLNQVPAQENVFDAKVHYHFLQKNFSAIIQLHKQYNIPIKDSWTLYRIGEAYFNNSDFVSSIALFEKAVATSPFNLDFLNKTAATYFNLGNTTKAKAVYEKIIMLQPKHKGANANLGYIYMFEGNIEKAKVILNYTLNLYPDYEQALINKAALHYQLKEIKECSNLLNRILKVNPENSKAKQLQQQLKSI
jgi:hypothetical protein